jgi:hypothetical protein
MIPNALSKRRTVIDLSESSAAKAPLRISDLEFKVGLVSHILRRETSYLMVVDSAILTSSQLSNRSRSEASRNTSSGSPWVHARN